MFVGKFGKTAVSLLAAITVSLVFTVGCSDDDDGPSGGGFVTEMGWEWASCEEYDDEEWCFVIMFRPNGEVWGLEYYGYGDDHWIEFLAGEWSELSNNRLHITPIDGVLWEEDDRTTFDYTLSNNGNTLTLSGETFTKQPSHRPNGGGGNLVLPTGSAWVDNDYGDYGVIFNSDNTFQDIYSYGLMWEVEDVGTYTTSSGGILNITYADGAKARMNYTVSGNTLILAYGELVRTNNITIADGDEALRLLCLTLVITGVFPSEELCMLAGGILFKQPEEVNLDKRSIFRRPQLQRKLSKR